MTEDALMTHGAAPRRIVPLLMILIICSFAVMGFFAFANTPHPSFPVGERVEIPEGSSLTYIAAVLDDRHVIRNAFLFRTFISFFDAEGNLHAGTHIFTKPLSTYAVARAFIDRSSMAPDIRVTIPEGSTLTEFDTILSGALPAIEKGEIVEAVNGAEGVLFPDTYFFMTNATATDVVEALQENYAEKLRPFKGQIDAHTLTEREIVTLASILEKEANDEASMRTVAGILLDRLKIGMPLQVDATFAYLLGKESHELTSEDLELDSPYNTYENRGLPPGPIGSPGIMAIRAVLEPIATPYLYYLTDRNGNFHYAETFDEHKENKARYLR